MNETNKESSAISRGCFAYKGKRKQLRMENYLDLSGAEEGTARDELEKEFARGKWLKTRVESLHSLLNRLSSEGELKLKKEMHSKLFGAVCEFISDQASRFKQDEIDAGTVVLWSFRI